MAIRKPKKTGEVLTTTTTPAKTPAGAPKQQVDRVNRSEASARATRHPVWDELTGLPAVESDVRARLGRVLRKLDLVSANVDDGLDTFENDVRHRKMTPPSVHADCWSPGSRRRFHLRALVWSDPAWRAGRRRCIRHQEALAELLRSRRFPFTTPAVVERSTSGLIWDLTEHVDGYNLPWRNLTADRLLGWEGKLDVFVRIRRDLQRIALPTVPHIKWTGFLRDYRDRAELAQRRGLLKERRRLHLVAMAEDFVKRDATASPVVLTHGDFNPVNVMFRYTDDRPFLLDWDHLRYSIPGDGYGRLWMFLANEPAWQGELAARVKDELPHPRDWQGFLVMAAAEVLLQCAHEFRVAGSRVKTVPDLTASAPLSSRVVKKYLAGLFRLLDGAERERRRRP